MLALKAASSFGAILAVKSGNLLKILDLLSPKRPGDV